MECQKNRSSLNQLKLELPKRSKKEGKAREKGGKSQLRINQLKVVGGESQLRTSNAACAAGPEGLAPEGFCLGVCAGGGSLEKIIFFPDLAFKLINSKLAFSPNDFKLINSKLTFFTFSLAFPSPSLPLLTFLATPI